MICRSEASLPLVPFEYYLLADDRADYPMAMLFMLDFSGELHRREFTQAVSDALDRHPLLRSHIRRGERNDWHWVEASDPQPFFSWEKLGAPLDFPDGKQIDLTQTVGLRIWVRIGAGRTELLLQVAHACCDGLGVMQFLEDLLAAYHRHTTGEQVALAPRDAERIALRGRFGLNVWRRMLRAPQELVGLLGAVEFMAHKPLPVPLHTAAAAVEPTPDFPAAVSHQFTLEQLAGLRTAARNQGATLNDLLIRDLFLALGEWTAQHEPTSCRRPLRIMVPVSLRSTADLEMPAVNIVSMVNLDRRPTKFRNPRALLRGISLEMWAIKRWKLGLTLVHLTSLVRKVSGSLNSLLPDSRCLATCMFSNLGPVLAGSTLPRDEGRIVAGNVRLDRLESAAPLRPHTRASFVVVTYGHEISLMMNYDAQTFSREHAQEFLRQFVARIELSLDERREAPSPPVPSADVPCSSVR